MTRKGSPLTPRTARAIGLAIGERCEGPIFPATPLPSTRPKKHAGMADLRAAGDYWHQVSQ